MPSGLSGGICVSTEGEDGSWMPVSCFAQEWVDEQLQKEVHDQESRKPNGDTQPGSKRTFVPSAGAVPYAVLKEQSPQRSGWRAVRHAVGEGPRRAREGPRRAREGPRRACEGPRRAREGPRRAREAHARGREGHARCPHTHASGAREGPRRAAEPSWRADPVTSEEAFKTSEEVEALKAEVAQLKETLATLTAAQFSQKVNVCGPLQPVKRSTCVVPYKPVKSGQQPGATSVKPFAGAHTEKEPGSFVTEKEIVTKGASEWKVSMSRKARRRAKNKANT